MNLAGFACWLARSTRDRCAKILPQSEGTVMRYPPHYDVNRRNWRTGGPQLDTVIDVNHPTNCIDQGNTSANEMISQRIVSVNEMINQRIESANELYEFVEFRAGNNVGTLMDNRTSF